MQNVCPNPGCGAAYNLAPEHVGRRINCKKCGAALIVEADGLHLAEAAGGGAAPFVFPGEEEARPQRAHRKSPAAGNPGDPANRLWTSVGSIASTLLFALGTVLVVLFLFLPIIDQLRIAAKQAEITAGNAREKGESDKPAKSSSAWDSKKKELEKDIIDMHAGASGRLWLYTIGMMFGVLCLAIASIGYLSAFQSTSRRVVGSIVICALILMIFITYVITSAIASMAAAVGH